ncbi:acyl-CoA dehydrogenase family protein [Nocardia violaceofusca]|uniref:acyl-CoA dehydrogenase family protein n=1 Tax=Nocardia violaceofusca TaxID=941182 RepID=UPI0007A515C6|nr:acyl-CoA dehydrogenase family protein [Nocardia violaceofusca]
MFNLELPKKLLVTANLAHQVAVGLFRPISRKYDLAEHQYPVELDVMAAVMAGMNDSGAGVVAGASGTRATGDDRGAEAAENVNGGNMAAMVSAIEACWGDAALMMTIPYQGLGNAAIMAVATDEQLARFGKVWAAMAITEPGFGSDSAAVTTTAVLDGDEWVLNGTKIFVTTGQRATHIVVWATVDRSAGRAAIKSFVVPRDAPGLTVARLENKLGVKASDTAELWLEDCRIPADNILGNPEVNVEKGFAGVMQTFDNTRPLVAAMAIGVARAALEELRAVLNEAGIDPSYDLPASNQPAAAAEFLRLEADWEAAYLLALRATWMADNKRPNSLEASMSKAKAGRMGTDVTLKSVELAGATGYSQRTLLEKWGRDSKILDIFEGTQQIQQLIVARGVLGLGSGKLK